MRIISPRTLALCAGVFAVSLTISYAIAAWTEPGGTPPDNNVAAPVNISDATQVKSGNLDIMGTVGIGTTAPTQKLDVEGYVKGRTGLCIGDQCCQNWTECVNLGGGGGGGGGGCQSNGESCYFDSECCSGACISSKCSPSGSGILPRSACANTLPTGNKRVFITRQAFTGSEISNETDADKKCQKAAQDAGMSNYGKFKSLVYWGTRNINAVITTYALFNGKKVGATDQCDWYRISDGGNDMFTLGTGTASSTNKGSGNYIWSPLQFDENGLIISSGNYWTGFKPNTALNGSYSLLTTIQHNFAALLGTQAQNTIRQRILVHTVMAIAPDQWAVPMPVAGMQSIGMGHPLIPT